MRIRSLILLSVLLLAVSCGGKEPKDADYDTPAIQLTLEAVSHGTATVRVESLYAEEVRLVCLRDDVMPEADAIVSEGIPAENGRAVFTGLAPGTKHYVFGVGIGKDGRRSGIERMELVTAVEAGDLYPWETGRDGEPFFADETLCTGGGVPNSNAWFQIPANWDRGRFAPHVSFVDDDGNEKWLFEAFLAITGIDPGGKNFGINNNGSLSADQESWANLIEYWMAPGGGFDELDAAISEAGTRIGGAIPPRYVILEIPDPIMFERFTDKSSSTSYWGTVDGRLLDFSRIDDQILALEWYIERARERFAALAPKHLELAGFYIVSEELVARPDGWNYQYKRWDRILPPVGQYLEARNEGLYWIPYLTADGTDMWRELGISYAWLQPNYYWDYSGDKPIQDAVRKLDALGMGIELEFEYSMVEGVMKTPGIMGPDGSGNYVFRLADVPALRERFRAYMDSYRAAGLYGKRPVALYSGSNALWQLANSTEKDDIAMYRELCRFISESPLRNVFQK